MSFEIIVQYFQNSESNTTETNFIKNIFGDNLHESDGFYELIYDEQTHSEIYGNFKEHFIEGFTIVRPGITPDLWEDIFKILQKEGFILYTTNSELAIIGNTNTNLHLPKEFSSKMPPRFVLQSKDIIKALKIT